MTFSLRLAILLTTALAVVFALGFPAGAIPLSIGLSGTLAVCARLTTGLRRGLFGALALIFLGTCAAFFALAAREHGRVAQERSLSTGCLQQIAISLRNYEACYSEWPPVCTRDSSGKALHSWRVIVLNDTSQAPYSGYNFREPWESAYNRQVIPQIPAVFRSPYDRGAIGATGYVAIDPAELSGFVNTSICGQVLLRLREQSKGRKCIAEVCNAGIPWTEPEDLALPEIRARVIQGICNVVQRENGIQVLFLDDELKSAESIEEVYQCIKFISTGSSAESVGKCR